MVVTLKVRGLMPAMPSADMRIATVVSETVSPSSWRSRVILGEP
jgi:hypothetical protein